MRSPAQIQVAALCIETYLFDILRQIVQKFDFVGFAPVFEQGNGLFTRHFLPLERIIGRSDFMHPLFNLLQVFRREGFGILEIVIETVFDGRTDADPDTIKRILNGLSHDMGNAVSKDGKALLRLNIDER
jgi:hypothetical protein